MLRYNKVIKRKKKIIAKKRKNKLYLKQILRKRGLIGKYNLLREIPM
jgi:hypothetical protein